MSQTARGLGAYAQPVSQASDASRTAFYQSVAMWTMIGLLTAFSVSAVSAFTVLTVPFLQGRYVMMGAIFGCMFITNTVAQRMVQGDAKIPGFVLGTAAEGVSLGYLMLAAVLMGADRFGAGAAAFTIIGEAAGLTLLAGAGMVSYLWSAPRELSMVRGMLQVMSLPMLALMVITFVFPIGGVFGMMLSLLFVGISSAGLLYSLNQVIHVCDTEQHMEAAYAITVGVLVLFWNIVVLLMKLQDRR